LDARTLTRFLIGGLATDDLPTASDSATVSMARAAEQVIVAGMPKLRAAIHLDTIFTFANRDPVTIYPGIVHGIHAFTLRPSDTPPGFEVTEETRPVP
jgi:arginine deiminase